MQIPDNNPLGVKLVNDNPFFYRGCIQRGLDVDASSGLPGLFYILVGSLHGSLSDSINSSLKDSLRGGIQ